ncbi:ferritin-like domain-containing protein [uncultured Tateyamaria sp.]|uniref:ferritin-like domain-containing protein n=1 Tax=uncultured Tateyamaria sp. TaxID=455651 RepID=UPI00262358FE|nr:ferritin-like domain-containing protein [uncultured Tateyamaria sp.]
MIEPAQLHESLCHILGNTCRLSRTAKSYEWNVSGRGAVLAQACFREQAEAMHMSIDPLAGHIVDLGGHAVLDYSDGVVAVNPPTANGIPTLSEMVRNLHEGHRQAIHSVGAAIDVAREADDESTVQLMAAHQAAHRAWRRRLALVEQDV